MSWFFKSEEEFQKNRIRNDEEYRLGWKNGIEAFENKEVFVDTWLLKIAGKTDAYIGGYVRGHQTAASLRLYPEDDIFVTKELLVDFSGITSHLPEEKTQAVIASILSDGSYEIEFAGKLEGLDRPLISFICSETIAKTMRCLYLKDNPL